MTHRILGSALRNVVDMPKDYAQHLACTCRSQHRDRNVRRGFVLRNTAGCDQGPFYRGSSFSREALCVPACDLG